MSVGENLHLPGFGDLEIIRGSRTTACVDPRPVSGAGDPLSLTIMAELTQRHSNLVFAHQAKDGAVRQAGATFGDIMTLMGALPDLPPEVANRVVLTAENEAKRKPAIHHDIHSHEVAEKQGCGHVDNATSGKHEDDYGLRAERVVTARKYLLPMAQMMGITVVSTLLEGEHQEAGIIIVDAISQTVKATDGNNQFFRYDRYRHQGNRLSNLANVAQQHGVMVSVDQLREAADQQTLATLGIIAKGLPIFVATLCEHENSIVPAGNV